MEWRKLNLTESQSAEAFEALDLVLNWPKLKLLDKLKWYGIWRQLCGCRPRALSVTMGQLGAAIGLRDTGARKLVYLLADRSLCRIVREPADKRCRLPGAQKWLIEFPHPADVESGQFARYCESEGTVQLRFEFAVDDLSVDGAAASEGAEAAVNEAPATLPFKLGQDAPSAEAAPPSSADARCSRPAAVASWPPVAKMEPSLRQVDPSPPSCRKDGANFAGGLARASSIIQDSNTIQSSHHQPTRQATAGCSGADGASSRKVGAISAGGGAATPTIVDAMTGMLDRLARRKQMLPHERVQALTFWRARILDVCDPAFDDELFEQFVENFATLIVDQLPATAVRNFFRRMERRKRKPESIRKSFNHFFTTSAKKLAFDCGARWPTFERKPR